MSYIVVDVESDGPCPGKYSMTEFGAVVVKQGLINTFHGKVRPISDEWLPEALAISGKSREEVMKFPEPSGEMRRFKTWLDNQSRGRPVFISDNLAYDWQFINYYFHVYLGDNPFGFSGRRIGDLYSGLHADAHAKWKHLRKTRHTHNPVMDAIGNAEALLAIKNLGLRIDLR